MFGSTSESSRFLAGLLFFPPYKKKNFLTSYRPFLAKYTNKALTRGRPNIYRHLLSSVSKKVRPCNAVTNHNCLTILHSGYKGL